MDKERVKKIFDIVKTVLVWVFVAVSVFMMVFTIFSVNTFDRDDRSVFGYKFYIVTSDSMKATDFAAGDLIIVKEVDPTTLNEGDIITFISQNEDSFNETITHKIRSLTTTDAGDPAFITYGTTTGENDKVPVEYPFIRGQYKTSLAGVGNFFDFLRSPAGYVCCILLPFVLLIGSQLINFIKTFREYRQEQQADKDAEINAERQRMEQELAELRAQLAEKNGTPTADIPPVDTPPANISPTDAPPAGE